MPKPLDLLFILHELGGELKPRELDGDNYASFACTKKVTSGRGTHNGQCALCQLPCDAQVTIGCLADVLSAELLRHCAEPRKQFTMQLGKLYTPVHMCKKHDGLVHRPCAAIHNQPGGIICAKQAVRWSNEKPVKGSAYDRNASLRGAGWTFV